MATWAALGRSGKRGRICQVCRLERQRVVKGKKQVDVSYAISSLPATDADARRLLSLSRGHWGIENRLHWVRDVSFDEDRSQVGTGAAPQVLAGLKNLVISLVRRAGHSNVAAALRRHNAHLSGFRHDGLYLPGRRMKRPCGQIAANRCSSVGWPIVPDYYQRSRMVCS